MPTQKKVSGNMFDSFAEAAIEAENQQFFGRMDRRYARIYTWANGKDKDEVTEQLALLLLLNLEDRKRVPIREKVMSDMLSEAYGKQRKQWMNSRKGGRAAGEQKKAEAKKDWQDLCVVSARKLLESRSATPRSVSSFLAPKYNKTAKQVRTVLQDAGVLKKGK